MARRSMTGGLALLLGCALANPVAKTREGASSPSRVRVGIAAASFRGDCEYDEDCTVQLAMAHTGARWRRVKIVAVRLLVDGVDLGPIQTQAIRRWQRGAYRSSGLDMKPFGSAKINIALAPIAWEQRLVEHDLAGGQRDILVEVDFEIDDEPLVVRSMFTVQRETERTFMVT